MREQHEEAPCTQAHYQTRSAETKRQMLDRRNGDIRHRFNELYEVQRMRLDDVIEKVAFEFYLAHSTVEKIISK